MLLWRKIKCLFLGYDWHRDTVNQWSADGERWYPSMVCGRCLKVECSVDLVEEA